MSTSIFLKYVGQVNSSDESTTKCSDRISIMTLLNAGKTANIPEKKREMSKIGLVKTICEVKVLMKLETILGKNKRTLLLDP